MDEQEDRAALELAGGDLDKASDGLSREPGVLPEVTTQQRIQEPGKKAEDEIYLNGITKSRRKDVLYVLEMLPNHPASQIHQVLRQRNYNFLAAIDDLVQVSQASSPAAPVKIKLEVISTSDEMNPDPSLSLASNEPLLVTHESQDSNLNRANFAPATTTKVCPETSSKPSSSPPYFGERYRRPGTPQSKKSATPTPNPNTQSDRITDQCGLQKSIFGSFLDSSRPGDEDVGMGGLLDARPADRVKKEPNPTACQSSEEDVASDVGADADTSDEDNTDLSEDDGLSDTSDGSDTSGESQPKSSEQLQPALKSRAEDTASGLKPKHTLKRPAEDMQEGRNTKRKSFPKAAETDEEEEAMGLESASLWVRSTLHANDGIHIMLNSGPHPCKIPERFLRKIPSLNTYFEANPTTNSAHQSLKMPGVSQATFDLALQYAVCHNGRLEKSQAASKALEVSALVNLAVFADRVGLLLGGNSSPFMTQLKALLVDQCLGGPHIRTAFEKLREGHRVRTLFVTAALRPYAEFYNRGQDIHKVGGVGADDDDSDSAGGTSTLSAAQRSAYRSTRFRYHREFKQLKDFRSALLEEFHAAWWSREIREKKYGRIIYTESYLVDPLTKLAFRV